MNSVHIFELKMKVLAKHGPIIHKVLLGMLKRRAFGMRVGVVVL